MLGRHLHPRTAANLADLVRVMNTYCSNLLEVTFMSDLFDLDSRSKRFRLFVARHDRFKPDAAAFLEQTLVRGEIERGEASRITGLPVRTA